MWWKRELFTKLLLFIVMLRFCHFLLGFKTHMTEIHSRFSFVNTKKRKQQKERKKTNRYNTIQDYHRWQLLTQSQYNSTWLHHNVFVHSLWWFHFFLAFLLLFILFISGAYESLLSSFRSHTVLYELFTFYKLQTAHICTCNIFHQLGPNAKLNSNWKWIQVRISFRNIWTCRLSAHKFQEMITNISKIDGNKRPKHNINWMINLFRISAPSYAFLFHSFIPSGLTLTDFAQIYYLFWE